MGLVEEFRKTFPADALIVAMADESSNLVFQGLGLEHSRALRCIEYVDVLDAAAEAARGRGYAVLLDNIAKTCASESERRIGCTSKHTAWDI